MNIEYVDICVGLAWGDEAKGKISAYLCKNYEYDFVCRWAGGNNAGHTIYVNNNKYVTNIIPSGIFYNVMSIIGPDCVVNVESFLKEVKYLHSQGLDTNLIKISPKAHIISDEHIEEDIQKYSKKLGTTSKGIAPCYRDKYGRIGCRVSEVDSLREFLWDENLYGKILCEGAQGFWLDINMGNYPYVTSSNTLPYSACSIGFAPRYIRNIYGAAKVYDTRVGEDPDFPDTLLENKELYKIGCLGEEYGSTTGRRRKVNWLNLDKLIQAINISGTNILVLSKVDILKQIQLYKYYHKKTLEESETYDTFISSITKIIRNYCPNCNHINFSDNPYTI